MLIDHGTLVLAMDGGQMQLLRNAGRGLNCELELICERSHKVPETAELGSDQAGRSSSSMGHRNHSYAETDLHDQLEERFLISSLAVLDDTVRDTGKLAIIIASPRALGIARKNYGAALKRQIMAEIDRDYAARPAADIAAMLSAI